MIYELEYIMNHKDKLLKECSDCDKDKDTLDKLYKEELEALHDLKRGEFMKPAKKGDEVFLEDLK